jgi:manganese/iron transport system ATP-binding protein
MTFLQKIRKTAGMERNVPHEPGAPFLKVSELSLNYDGLPALQRIGFEVGLGERVAVVGPNGAGKSTLFKVIAGVLEPSAGEVAISGHSPGGHICIAYLPQRSQVDWNFPVTVADVVMMGRTGKLGLMRRPKQEDRDYVLHCLEIVGMGGLAGRRINELSGGQQQRMFIAQALSQEAELLLMDEPLTGLDVSSEEEVFEILEQLHQRGVTMLISTHDLGVAMERFESVMLLNHSLIGLGNPAQVFTEQNLRLAYGEHLQKIPTENGAVLIADTHVHKTEQ